LRTIPKPIAAPLIALLLPFIAADPTAAGRAGDAPPAREETSAPRDQGVRARDDAGDRLSRIEQAMWHRDPEAAPLLREWAAGDPNDRVRERSVGALAIIRDPEATPVFLGRLNGDPSAAVRRAAAEAIGLLRPKVNIERLAEPLRNDADPFVRAECARAIGRIGMTQLGGALLVSLVQDPSQEVRAVAAEAIATLRPREAADVLRAVARQDAAILVRIYAVRALAEISPGPSVSLFRAVWDGPSDPDLRLEAFRGLLLAESGEAWERAGLADEDERVRFLAFREWLSRTVRARAGGGGMPDGDFAARLEGFLADRVRGIRELAKDQMETLGFRVRSSGFGYAVER